MQTKNGDGGGGGGGGDDKMMMKKDQKQVVVVPKPLPFHKLLRYADLLDWILMILGTSGAIVHGTAQPVGYLLLGKALNAFANNMNDTQAMVTALNKVVPFFWYMAIATFPAGILEIGCWMYTSERQSTRLRLAFFRAVITQDIGTFDTHLTTGKIIAGMTNHMSVIQDAIGEKLGHFISSLATFFAGILIAFLCCWQVALLTVLVIPLISVIGATYAKKMHAISTMRMLYLSEVTSMVEQTLSQIKTVFAFVGEKTAMKTFSECMEKQFTLSKREAAIKGVGTGMLQMVIFCSWALMVWIGAVAVAAKKSNGGDTIAAVMSILFGAISLTYAAPDMQIFNQAKVVGNEIFEVIQRKSAINYESKETVLLEKISGSIDFRGVSFAYPSQVDKMVLQSFSLSIPAGKVVALVGASGCGKSTTISLVQRFYDPYKGEIFVDGHNIKDIDLKFLRTNIAAVSQEPSLFVGTIKDNIKVGNMSANDNQVEEASLTANAHCFISQFPNQYATEVGERGVQLSGGQKQRIAIARALLKDPPILLLDEATSALDSDSEILVQNALEKAMQGRTVILIAHRMSTVIGADMIAIVDNGQVIETGTHTELLSTSEFYSKLFNMQDLSIGSESRDLSTGEATSSVHGISKKDIDQPGESLGENQLRDSSVKDAQNSLCRTFMFFRIWFGLNRNEIGKTAIGSVAAALSGISKPIFGFFIITIGVAYYREDAKQKVGGYSGLFYMLGLLSLVTHTVQHYFYGIVGEKAMTNLRKALYSAVLRNELSWFEKPDNSVGALTSKIINDTALIKTIISDRMSVIVQCISSIVIATTVSMIVSWRMGLVAWAVMPCHFFGGLIQAKSAKGFSGDFAIAHQEIVALASESATNIRTIASFSHEEHILEKARISLEKPIRKSRIESVKYGVIHGLSLCLWNTAHAVALWYATILVDKKLATFENAVRSYQIFSLTVPSITELWTLVPTVISAISVLTPAFHALDRIPEMNPDTPENSNSGSGRIKGKIDFEDVGFSYPMRQEVTILDNFNLVVEAGSKVALVGPSGAGKSSVLALILRFYDPKHGRILIDGKDLKDYNLRWLRTQIGLVQQEPLLFNLSIRDNICYGNEDASETEIVEVSMAVKIHEFIANLPLGYDSVVGAKGCQLSGGQKQRIAIARTLLKRPAILLLDEATSALDAESERAVINALGSAKMNSSGGLLSRTTHVTVAHRLTTVMKSDIIVVMDKGKVVEMGSHSILLESTEGIYSRFFHLQSSVQN